MVQFGKIATPEVMEIVSIIDRVRETGSTLAKQAILRGNKDNEGLKTVLELTYNPHKKFKMTNKTLLNEKHNKTEDCSCYLELTKLANDLAENNTNDYYKQECCAFLRETDESIRDLYKGVLLKDLKIGVNATTINKIWDGLIPTGETGIEIKPMLASKFDLTKPPKGKFAVTEKLDGIRCVVHYSKDAEEPVQLYSRQGKRILGCIEIEDAIKENMKVLDIEDAMLDGELLTTDCSYEDVYKETTKRVKNKNEVKEGIKYVVFDMLILDHTHETHKEENYYKRRSYLRQLKSVIIESCIEVLPMLYVGDDINELIKLLDEYRDKGAEGLMVNLLDAPYEFKRSKSILKVKVMQTADLRIVGFEEGQGRNEGKLGALLVDFKGNTVGVGSGFTDFDREYIWNNQDQYIGKIVEVQYFEITKDKTGIESLRFPVYKHMRTDKTEPSLY